ncbi:hypothetical protein WA026_021082 [Henosepilachna vigintioctopunctata]|uniref:Gustatory receptor n=1 Tax=Henosepilachna vigintioctopunctata TaxID=420089 RepID=A0AAW1V558_9CUCU
MENIVSEMRISHILLTLMDVIGICMHSMAFIKTTYSNQNKWSCMLKSFSATDTILRNKNKLEENILSNPFFQFIGPNLLAFGYIIIRIYVLSKKNNYSTVASLMSLFLNFSSATIIYNIIISLKLRYEDCNELLTKHLTDTNFLGGDILKTFRQVERANERIRMIMTLFNDIFGWHLLGLMVRCVISLLVILDYLFFNLEQSNKDHYNILSIAIFFALVMPVHQQSSEIPAIVNQDEVTIELQNYYSGHNENSKKLQWTNQRIQSVIKLLDEYNTIKSQGKRPTTKHYHHARKYDVMNIGN